MMALLGRSLYEILSQSGSGYLDSLVGFIFFLLIGRWFQQKTYHQLSFDRDYTSYFPISTIIMRNNTEESVGINNLNPGDRIIIRHGELIPTDSILINGNAHIDYSFVTGESRPVSKESGDKIFAGGKQMGGLIELEVEKSVEQSYLTQLWNDAGFKSEETPNLRSKITDKIAQPFTITVLLITAILMPFSSITTVLFCVISTNLLWSKGIWLQ